jgi:DtxR family Mn-dependent transcriptional regulator
MRGANCNNALTASQEDYLEAIFALLQTTPVARSKDIAARLGVRAASVTGALRQLAGQGCIQHEVYGFVTLTPEGQRLAADVVKRHALLKDFLTRILAIPEADAEDTACRLEHALPPTVQQRLVRFVEFLDACPVQPDGWQERFRYFREHGQLPASCARCAARQPAPGSAPPKANSRRQRTAATVTLPQPTSRSA